MVDLATHIRRQLPRWELTRDEAWLEKAKARLADLEGPGLSMSNTKAELLAAAEAEGIAVDESMTKSDILAALKGTD